MMEKTMTNDAPVTILDRIAASTRMRVERKKAVLPFAEIIRQAQQLGGNTGFPFEKAIRKEGLSFICEIKKASPSKGIIAHSFPYARLAKEYEEAGADAISVLTEPEFFLGSDEHLAEISRMVSIPLLRKDFVVDNDDMSWQIPEQTDCEIVDLLMRE